MQSDKQKVNTWKRQILTMFVGKPLAGFIIRKAKSILPKDKWFIAYRAKSNLDLANFTLNNFTVINPPQGKFFADPFLVKTESKNYIFFENYDYSTNKGVISYVEIKHNGNFTSSEVALEKEYHLSYPHIFSLNNKFYMIPETCNNKTIELYEAVEFPHKWEMKNILIENIIASDTTIFHHNNKYWLFTNISTPKNPSTWDKLYLFHSDSLYGNWIAHLKNPIVSDIKTSRPAGNLFRLNGDIIRPSQDSSIRYGYALNFNRIDILSEENYKETLIKKVTPDSLPYNQAVHTFNCNDDFEVIDGIRNEKYL